MASQASELEKKNNTINTNTHTHIHTHPSTHTTIHPGANHRGGGCPTFSSTNPALAQLVGETANATEKVVTISSPLLYHIEPELGFNLFFYDGADDNCVARGGQQRVLVLCKPDDTVRGGGCYCYSMASVMWGGVLGG